MQCVDLGGRRIIKKMRARRRVALRGVARVNYFVPIDIKLLFPK